MLCLICSAITANLITRTYDTFASFEKPKHSTNYSHCKECAEYDDLLANVLRQSLTLEQIGTVAWGPIAFLTPDAMAYYFPRLAELAILNVVGHCEHLALLSMEYIEI